MFSVYKLLVDCYHKPSMTRVKHKYLINIISQQTTDKLVMTRPTLDPFPGLKSKSELFTSDCGPGKTNNTKINHNPYHM